MTHVGMLDRLAQSARAAQRQWLYQPCILQALYGKPGMMLTAGVCFAVLLPVCPCSRIDYDEFCRMMLADEHERRGSKPEQSR